MKKKVINRERFCLQVLKQVLIFPDSSVTSSCISVNRYDPILFSDEQIHTVFKILETQREARKIWAFINLRMHRKIKQIKEAC